MTDILIYGGLGIMFLGGIFGLYVAIRGYKATDWKNVKSISSRALFMREPVNPQMKRLIRIWSVIMILGFILVGTGIYTGLR